MRRWPLILAGLLFLSVGLVAAQRESLEPRTLMAPMRDGVRLASDLYSHPTEAGPWPVILTRTPYGRGDREAFARGLVRRGYAFVSQDMRGRFDSEGEDTAFLTDACGELQDGYDTIEWLSAQEWCDGNVGTKGGSAMGITQYMAVASAPPHLRCCSVGAAAPSIYHYAAYYGGVLRKNMAEGWLRGQKFRPENLELVKAHPYYDDMWRTVNLAEYAGQVTVPMIHRGGWLDCFQGGTIFAYETLQEHGGQGARGNQFLVVGGGAHGPVAPEALEFPDGGKKSGFTHEPEFFAHYLKDEENEVTEIPHVYYFVMGAVEEEGAPGNFWRTSDQWPPEAEQTPFYCHADGTLSPEAPGDAEASMSYQYDPEDPVPTIGGANLGLPKGSFDQRPVEDREDVQVFTTDPLPEPVEVTGHIQAVLFISSDCRDTDFTAKLTDVYPDGRSQLLCDGIQRAKLRNSLEQPELLEAGEVYRIEVDMWSTSMIFNTGHRIRLAVSSSNYPRFSANPNTGAPNDEGEEKRVATNTIYLGGDRASHVILPAMTADNGQ